MSTLRTVRRAPARPPEPGFAGPGHTAVDVLSPRALAASDPFVLLMDDRIDFAPGRQIGGPHPHAGLETVTLVLSGAVRDRDEGRLVPGDAVWMTAGRGVVHNEEVVVEQGPGRVLQLWIGLPARHRDAEPALQYISGENVPVRRAPGVEARLYSGLTGHLVSSTRNLVPVTLVDFVFSAPAVIDQALPAAYGGFLYVLEGEVTVGDVSLGSGDLGWLDRGRGDEETTLRLSAADDARVVLYAGRPHGEPLLQHGPFVAGSEREVAGFFHAFRQGSFASARELAGAGPLTA